MKDFNSVWLKISAISASLSFEEIRDDLSIQIRDDPSIQNRRYSAIRVRSKQSRMRRALGRRRRRRRRRRNDEAGVRTRTATSLLVILSVTSGRPLSTDEDNVVGPMILRLTLVLCRSPFSPFCALFLFSLSPLLALSLSLSLSLSLFLSCCAVWYHCDCAATKRCA